MKLFLIALFGAIGTLSRYGLQGVVQIRMGSMFPYGTLFINLTGCFLLGFIGQLTLNRLLVSSDIGKWNLQNHRMHIESSLTVEGFIWAAKC